MTQPELYAEFTLGNPHHRAWLRSQSDVYNLRKTEPEDSEKLKNAVKIMEKCTELYHTSLTNEEYLCVDARCKCDESIISLILLIAMATTHIPYSKFNETDIFTKYIQTIIKEENKESAENIELEVIDEQRVECEFPFNDIRVRIAINNRKMPTFPPSFSLPLVADYTVKVSTGTDTSSDSSSDSSSSSSS